MMLNCSETFFSDVLANWTRSQRESLPLRKRKRYLRGSTLSFGQVFPFTTMTLPKNSGFQMGEISEPGVGMYGPVKPSKNTRESGEKSEPSLSNDRSCMRIGISYLP